MLIRPLLALAVILISKVVAQPCNPNCSVQFCPEYCKPTCCLGPVFTQTNLNQNIRNPPTSTTTTTSTSSSNVLQPSAVYYGSTSSQPTFGGFPTFPTSTSSANPYAFIETNPSPFFNPQQLSNPKFRPTPIFNPYPVVGVSFSDYALIFKKTYNSPEMVTYRSQVYQRNLQTINLHNFNMSRLFNMGVNQFTDLTPEQFVAKQTSLRINVNSFINIRITGRGLMAKIPPPSIIIDWHCKKREVRSQGNCGGCYAFSTVEAIEITQKIYDSSNLNFPLSVQELLSCSQGNKGCLQGQLYNSFEYAVKQGLSYEVIYSFDSYNGVDLPCNRNLLNEYRSFKKFIKSYQKFNFNDCEQIANGLLKKPIAVAISSKRLQSYVSGVFNQAVEDTRQLNHGVVLVGFNYQYGFYFKNSWGNAWGEFGYGWVDYHENAGVCMDAYTPTIEAENLNSAFIQSC